jgi:hypothetical protein
MPSDEEAARVYNAAIRKSQDLLAAHLADHDGKITSEDTINALFGVLDDGKLVRFQRRRGDIDLAKPLK